MHRSFWMVTLGAAVALALNATIASLLNPLLTSVKISYQ